MQMLHIKAVCGSQHRRFSVSRNGSYSELMAKVEQVFRMQISQLAYEDPDRDLIHLNSDCEVEEMYCVLQGATTVRLTVIPQHERSFSSSSPTFRPQQFVPQQEHMVDSPSAGTEPLPTSPARPRNQQQENSESLPVIPRQVTPPPVEPQSSQPVLAVQPIQPVQQTPPPPFPFSDEELTLLKQLAELGFSNVPRNRELLAQHNNDIQLVVESLIG
eukprot:c9007_g1_i1.p1 GENE.c9007_g1_i1~~c9007_g1_i1.p1  ORF type:complete len:216 (-),score=39.05 c9007_g1_i1:42-689(-)